MSEYSPVITVHGDRKITWNLQPVGAVRGGNAITLARVENTITGQWAEFLVDLDGRPVNGHRGQDRKALTTDAATRLFGSRLPNAPRQVTQQQQRPVSEGVFASYVLSNGTVYQVRLMQSRFGQRFGVVEPAPGSRGRNAVFDIGIDGKPVQNQKARTAEALLRGGKLPQFGESPLHQQKDQNPGRWTRAFKARESRTREAFPNAREAIDGPKNRDHGRTAQSDLRVRLDNAFGADVVAAATGAQSTTGACL